LPAVNDGEFCGHHILRGADLEDKVPELDDLAQQLYRVGRLVETQRLEPAVGRAVAYIAKVTLETKLLSNAGRPKVSELNLTPEQLQAMPPDQRQALLEAYRRSQEN
jgi:hypothetical protein